MNKERFIDRLQRISRVRLFKDITEASPESFSQKVYEVVTAHSKAVELLNLALKWRQETKLEYEDLKSLTKLQRTKLMIEDEFVNDGNKNEKKDRCEYQMRGLIRNLDEKKNELEEYEALVEMARNVVKDAEIRKQGLNQQLALYKIKTEVEVEFGEV